MPVWIRNGVTTEDKPVALFGRAQQGALGRAAVEEERMDRNKGLA